MGVNDGWVEGEEEIIKALRQIWDLEPLPKEIYEEDFPNQEEEIK